MNQQSLPSHNPAERLLVILTELANSPGDKAILAVFSEVLNINADSDSTSFFCKGVIPIFVLNDLNRRFVNAIVYSREETYRTTD